MSQTGVLQSRYVKAGAQMKLNMRINMRDSADLPDAETTINDESRQVFKACETAMAKWNASVSIWVALAIVLFFVLVISAKGNNLLDAKLHAEKDLETLQSQYTEVSGEVAALQADFDKVCDSSYICRRAVQKLGMKRAANEAVIHISAPNTRPPSIENGILSASMHGQ